MLWENSYELILQDTPVPDLFIVDKMFSLSLIPLKLYLRLLYDFKKHEHNTSSELANILGCSDNEIKKAMTSLAIAGLIDLAPDGNRYEFTDLKLAELKNLLQMSEAAAGGKARVAGEGNAADNRAAKNSFERYMQDINKTFFHGGMTPTWYHMIETIIDQYHFDRQVMYCLVRECSERGNLRNYFYLKSVAKSWSERGIITYNDLIRDQDKLSLLRVASRLVGKSLRRTVTAADEEIIGDWIFKHGYKTDVLEYLLQKTPNLRNPTITALNTIVKKWVEAGLADLAAIEAFEQAEYRRLTSGTSVTSASSAISASSGGMSASFTGSGRSGRAGAARNAKGVKKFTERPFSYDGKADAAFINALLDNAAAKSDLPQSFLPPTAKGKAANVGQGGSAAQSGGMAGVGSEAGAGAEGGTGAEAGTAVSSNADTQE